MLVVGVAAKDASTSDLNITSVTFNNVALTAVPNSLATAGAGSSTVNRTQLFSLLHANLPGAGTFTVRVSFAGSVTGAAAGAISLIGVAQNSPEAVATNSATNTSSLATNVNVITAGAWLVDVIGKATSGNFNVASSGMTERYDRSSTGAGCAGASKPAAATGPTTMAWNASSAGNLAHSVIALAPSVGGPPAFSLTTNISGSGSVARNPNAASYAAGTVVTLTATPAAGFQFAGWSGDLTGTTNPAQITMSANRTVTATFTAVGQNFTLITTIVGSGSVSRNPNAGAYASGTVVTLTATPAAGFQFAGWSGDLSGSTNPAPLLMNANKAVTATFTPVGQNFTLTTNVAGSGTITRSPNASSYPSGTVVTLTATPAAGFQFSSWSGDLSGSANPASITMSANRTVTATFTPTTTGGSGAVGAPSGFAAVNALGLATTTGGAGGRVVAITNVDDLRANMDLNEALILRISGTMDLGGNTTALRQNKTLVGVGPNARIINGGLELFNRSNIIIQNLTFVNAPDDCLKVNQGTHHLWVDHCTFTDGDLPDPEGANHDGLFDITRQSSYITISYCLFLNHAKTILIGHSDGASTDIGTLKTTIHHNWFNGTLSRHPRVRFGEVHVYNNYYLNNAEYGVASTMEADVVVEGNYFSGVQFPTHVGFAESAAGDLVERNNVFANSGAPETRGAAFNPATYYSYTVDPPNGVPASVAAQAGAGKVSP